MLEIQNLCKQYGRFMALNHMNLHIEKGELFGFVGPNGAGKTTTMKIVSGLLRADFGTVMLDGVDALRDNDRLKERIGYMPDFFGVYDNLKAIEYMEFYASAYGIVGKDATNLCMELMDLVNLKDKADTYVDTLSRGMKQRLCLARSMVHNPDILILDEPASGLDPRARFEMKEILRNLHDMGKTILISSHILPELAQMCTTIGIIEKGQMVVKGTVDEIMGHLNTSNPLEIQVTSMVSETVEFLKELPLVETISIEEQKLIVKYNGGPDDERELLKMMIAKDFPVHSFARNGGNLEDVFMEITGKKGAFENEITA